MREKQPRLLVIWEKYDLSFYLSETGGLMMLTFPMLKSTSSMLAISRLIPRPIRLRRLSVASWVLRLLPLHFCTCSRTLFIQVLSSAYFR